ncbi:MAG TPA: MoxR family ATPase [Candidatus Hydrogenedentes bacterium]|jgi:MoxR-like ATPase|nr:MoxR family ATPase [Candidatus Hydrogenedentota bacterium]
MLPETGEQIQRIIDNVERVVFGKRDVVKMCVIGLLARGHLLIEDVPGIGKTTLAQSLARSVDCSFTRIQFTSDMLPSDVLGVSIINPKTNDFEFRFGPIFANFVLADEINRTPPKTQSALLEAMSEYTVSADSVTYPLPRPFMVIATQNPIEYEGTYVLPESQMDRFLLRVDIGYPPETDELRIMRRHDPVQAIASLKPVINAEELIRLQEEAERITVDASIEHYILNIVRATRDHEHVRLGASPRGAQALFEASQARAMVEGRDYVTPDDVKLLAAPTLAHRLLVKSRGADLAAAGLERLRIIREIVNVTKVPV